MTDPFVHLHVASGYSLRYGASPPGALVARAAEAEMTALALTDRDGAYGAVKFITACRDAGLRPLLGVDLAVASVTRCGSAAEEAAARTAAVPTEAARTEAARTEAARTEAARTEARRTPVRGGASVDLRWPRVTLLAADGRGWGALCRIISATHLAGERGRPVTTLEIVAAHVGSGAGVLALLGPDSEVGRALAARRVDRAVALLGPWREVFGGDLIVEVVDHRGAGDTARAARLLGFAREQRLPTALTNAVRYAGRGDAVTADLLDAARRLVPLGGRHVDRRTGEGYLKTGKEMAAVAGEVARAAGLDDSAARRLLAQTAATAERCAIDPARDLGIGVVHFPELEVTSPPAGMPAGIPAGMPAGTGARLGPGAGPGVGPDSRGPDAVLRARCEAGLARRGLAGAGEARSRLVAELEVIARLGYASYFLTVADVVELIRALGVRCAARGSGAGSLVNYLLGVSGVDPLRHGLVLERFLSPLRAALPDIDLDVESARRTQVYEAILARYGGDRCTCVSMMDTYRVRHAIRDVGAALGMAPSEIDTLAKAFPHVRAGQARAALRELPELRASGIDPQRYDLLFRLVERLDGLPRHVALHPCGVLLSDRTLLERTPVEASWMGFPMSQFDKDDVEALGLLKLDVLGVRMQSAMAHAVSEIARSAPAGGARLDLDALPLDDPATFRLIQSTRTLGVFQIESPGQRELIGKFAPQTFDDLIIDISLFRPGPVKTDMVTPFLEARQGWRGPQMLHPDLVPVLAQTGGVVVFHEQVLRIVATTTGCSLAEADEVRRALGDPDGQEEVRTWFYPAALARGYPLPVVERVWQVLRGFASFGFCKAHAAAFALPTYQSAWLKAHHPAAFLAGVLTHDPGMYPKRLILDDARQFGIAVLSLDVNRSDAAYRVERVGALDEPPPQVLGEPPRRAPAPGLPDARGYGIRLALSEVKGITDAEVARIVAGRPYGSLSDFWQRAAVSRPVVERLVLAGGFDALYGIGSALPVRRRGQVTRRDLLLQVAELDAWDRSTRRIASRRRPHEPRGAGADDVRALAARQSQAPAAVTSAPMQLALPLDEPEVTPSGLPEMTDAERVRAELEVLGLDASRHVLDLHAPLLTALGVTRARDLVHCRSRAAVLVAGVKVATQTPPVRSGRRVVFVTLDDATGPIDATFFEDAQAGCAATLFHSWLLVVQGEVRRTGPRGVSLRATGCWELSALHAVWQTGGLVALAAAMGGVPAGDARPAGGSRGRPVPEEAVRGAAASRSTRPVMVEPPAAPPEARPVARPPSPYADVAPPGVDGTQPPRKLWHASPGSAGR